MKKLFTLACGVALLNVVFLANAQSQDTALAKIDSKRDVGEDQQKRNVAAAITPDEVTSEKATRFSAEKFVLPFDKLEKRRSILNSKVGPNGEELMMEKDGYYVIDEVGKKVKVELTSLKDKPKQSY